MDVHDSIWSTFFAALEVVVALQLVEQKGESQNRCFKKTKQAKFPKNEYFLPPDTHTQGVKNVRFFFLKI